MKVHLVLNGSMACTPNVGRLTTRRERTTTTPDEVTCDACKRRMARMRPEYLVTLGKIEVTTR